MVRRGIPAAGRRWQGGRRGKGQAMSVRVRSGEFVQQWGDWREQRERELADPYGWLALVSLDWLEEKPREYPGLPGRWWQDKDAAYLDPQGAEFSYEDEPV